MNSEFAINAISQYISEYDLIISSLGRTAELLYLNKTNNDQILFTDCLGTVTGIATGLALACPKVNVFSFDTDGSFFYNINVLNTISIKKDVLSNLKVFVIDNELLESGGEFPSGSKHMDWELLTQAWGIKSHIIKKEPELIDYLTAQENQPGLKFAVIKVDNNSILNTCKKDIDGIESKYCFKRFIKRHINGDIIHPCIKN